MFHTLMHKKEGKRVARVEIVKRKADVAHDVAGKSSTNTRMPCRMHTGYKFYASHHKSEESNATYNQLRPAIIPVLTHRQTSRCHVDYQTMVRNKALRHTKEASE